MPPKSKFTREEVVLSALRIIQRDGLENLTARSLGKEMGSSARPIFTVFENMEELQKEVINYAKRLYSEYIERGLNETPAFKGVGKEYIRFASEQPKLFQLLFMREQGRIPDTDNILSFLDYNNEKILKSIEDGYGLSSKIAKEVYLHLWIYAHGIAVLIATRVCVFSCEEISSMLTTVFISILSKIKSENKND